MGDMVQPCTGESTGGGRRWPKLSGGALSMRFLAVCVEGDVGSDRERFPCAISAMFP
jgi:hypothetical protein